MSKYARTLQELKEKAVLFWPKELREREAAISVLPLLLETQEQFISVLTLADAEPDAWKKLVDFSEKMKGNLFLKHLMVLSDFAGEALNKLPPFRKYFDDGVMEYVWHERLYSYKFNVIHNRTSLGNSALRVDGRSLIRGHSLNDKMEDVVMLLLHGATSVGDALPEDKKSLCTIGSLIGQPDELTRFVKQNYIRVSTQLKGATSNALGQAAQNYTIETLKRELPNWQFIRNGTIPGISHNQGKTETSFDIVAISPQKHYFGIEVSFQFTTNSVIERKSGQAEARANMVHRAGHHICYVIDGAGNINVRESAVQTICRFSDCTVALSPAEIKVLAQFLHETASIKDQE